VESGEVLVYLTVQEIMPARIFGLRFSIFYAFLTIGTACSYAVFAPLAHAKANGRNCPFCRHDGLPHCCGSACRRMRIDTATGN
jgi:hypothetical protein